MLLPDPAPDGEIYLTTAQAAEAMRVKPPVVRRWVRIGYLPEVAPGWYMRLPPWPPLRSSHGTPKPGPGSRRPRDRPARAAVPRHDPRRWPSAFQHGVEDPFIWQTVTRELIVEIPEASVTAKITTT